MKRWLFRIFGIFVLLIVGLVAVVPLIPADRIAAIAAQQFEAQTGRKLVIDGGVSPRILPTLGVKAEGVRIDNAPWAGDAPMVEAQSLVVGVDPWALISGQIDIRRLELVRPVIRLSRSADGRANWEVHPQSAAAPASDGRVQGQGAGAALPDFSLARGMIQAGEVIYEDAAAGQAWRVEALDGELRLPSLDDEATATLSARVNGEELRVEMRLASLRDVIAGGLAGLSVEASGAFGTVGFKGRAAPLKPSLEGRVELTLSDIAAVGRLAGVGAVSVPQAALPVAAEATVTLPDIQAVYLRGLRLKSGAMAFLGDMDLSLNGPRPKLVARLEAGPLDLSPFTGGGGRAGGPGTANTGDASGTGPWPTDPIDASALALADAELELSTPSLRTGYADFGPTRLRISNDRARAVIRLEETTLYKGRISGTVVVNNRAGLSASAKAVARGVRLQPFLAEFAGYDRLKGAADFELDLLTAGGSVDAMMKALRGTARIAIGQGEIIGFDLAGMIRTLDTSYRGQQDKTIFESVTASFDVAGGVARNDDLAFKSPVMDVAGAGDIDIGNQLIDYTLTPTRFRGDGSQTDTAYSVPVHVRGSWSSPQIRPDVDKLLQTDPTGALQAVQGAVERAVRDNVGAIDGAAGSAGQVDPDALRKTIEDKAGKALQGILGGN